MILQRLINGWSLAMFILLLLIPITFNRFENMPRWRGLNHFESVMNISFNDGSKNRDIAKAWNKISNYLQILILVSLFRVFYSPPMISYPRTQMNLVIYSFSVYGHIWTSGCMPTLTCIPTTQYLLAAKSWKKNFLHSCRYLVLI